MMGGGEISTVDPCRILILMGGSGSSSNSTLHLDLIIIRIGIVTK